MNYLTKFDSDGKRITSYPLDGSITDEEYAELLNEGYIEIDEEDWNYYVGNKGGGDNGTGYIYDNTTGKPISAPPYTPSKEKKLAALEADYTQQKQALINQYTDDMLHGDEDAMAEEKAAMDELDAWFDTEYAKIEEE